MCECVCGSICLRGRGLPWCPGGELTVFTTEDGLFEVFTGERRTPHGPGRHRLLAPTGSVQQPDLSPTHTHTAIGQTKREM